MKYMLTFQEPEGSENIPPRYTVGAHKDGDYKFFSTEEALVRFINKKASEELSTGFMRLFTFTEPFDFSKSFKMRGSWGEVKREVEESEEAISRTFIVPGFENPIVVKESKEKYGQL